MTEKPRGGGRGGRPSYQPSAEAKRTVEEMKFCGASDAAIARALKIDDDTLRKHFPAELADGQARKAKELYTLLFRAARKGNISAVRQLVALGAAATPGETGGAVKKPVKLGKKEERQQAAEEVKGKYSTPSAPKLVVNNS